MEGAGPPPGGRGGGAPASKQKAKTAQGNAPAGGMRAVYEAQAAELCKAVVAAAGAREGSILHLAMCRALRLMGGN